jgi:hypothetical protein
MTAERAGATAGALVAVADLLRVLAVGMAPVQAARVDLAESAVRSAAQDLGRLAASARKAKGRGAKAQPAAVAEE